MPLCWRHSCSVSLSVIAHSKGSRTNARLRLAMLWTTSRDILHFWLIMHILQLYVLHLWLIMHIMQLYVLNGIWGNKRVRCRRKCHNAFQVTCQNCGGEDEVTFEWEFVTTTMRPLGFRRLNHDNFVTVDENFNVILDTDMFLDLTQTHQFELILRSKSSSHFYPSPIHGDGFCYRADFENFVCKYRRRYWSDWVEFWYVDYITNIHTNVSTTGFVKISLHCWNI